MDNKFKGIDFSSEELKGLCLRWQELSTTSSTVKSVWLALKQQANAFDCCSKLRCDFLKVVMAKRLKKMDNIN